MDNFANLKPAERRPYFEEAANRRNSTTTAVEKDFWVCWTLKHPFALQGISESLQLSPESVGCKLKFLGLRGWLQEETGSITAESSSIRWQVINSETRLLFLLFSVRVHRNDAFNRAAAHRTKRLMTREHDAVHLRAVVTL